MVCFLKRAERMKLKVPQDEFVERDAYRFLGTTDHEEAERIAENMTDQDYIGFITYLHKIRKNKKSEYQREESTAQQMYA